MDIATGSLFVLVGLLAGGLLVLLVDTHFLGRRVQAAVDAKRGGEERLRSVEKKLARSEMKMLKLAEDLKNASEELAQLDSEYEIQQADMEAGESELNTLQDNLTRVNDHAEELREEKQALKGQLAVAEARANTLQEHFDRLDMEVRELREKYEQTCQRLTATEVEMKYLQRDLGGIERLGETDPVRTQMDELAETAGDETDTPELEDPEEATKVEIETAETEIVDVVVEGNEKSENLAGSPNPDVGIEPAEEEPDIVITATNVNKVEEEVVQERINVVSPIEMGEVQEIRGIGPVYAHRLDGAGITSIADLAEQTPEHLIAVLGLKSSQSDRAEAWIEQARLITKVFSDEVSPPEAVAPPPATDQS